MFLKILIISSILLFIASACLAIKILLKSDGRFPEIHISRNKEMQKKGITCARRTDTGCTIKRVPENCEICGTEKLLKGFEVD